MDATSEVLCDNGIVVRAGQTWDNGRRLLQVQANGTPATFKIGEFTVPGLRVAGAYEMDGLKLGRKLKNNGFGLSDKKIVLR